MLTAGRVQVTAGKPLANEYKTENTDLVRAGCCNLQRHIENCAKFGIPVVVGINRFVIDTDAELDTVRQCSLDAGVPPPALA